MSKWWSLNSALGYDITPLPYLVLLHLILSASLQLCLVPASSFLSLDSPQLVLTWLLLWIRPGHQIAPCGSSPLLVPTSCLTLGLPTFALDFTLWGFWLLLSGPALPEQLVIHLVYPGIDLDVPLVPSPPQQPLFRSRLQSIQLPSLSPKPVCELGQHRH